MTQLNPLKTKISDPFPTRPDPTQRNRRANPTRRTYAVWRNLHGLPLTAKTKVAEMLATTSTTPSTVWHVPELETRKPQSRRQNG